MVIFTGEDSAVRRNLWRSLFVLDRFLASSLGRPTAISIEDCSGDALKQPERASQGSTHRDASPASRARCASLEAAVRSCNSIGEILKKVYSKRKVSTRVTQEIANQLKIWSLYLDPSLHWRQVAQATSPSHGIAIVHVNMLYCHSIILLTRPFFLFLLAKVQQQQSHGSQSPLRGRSRTEKFSEACVTASCHVLDVIQSAHEAHFLPQRNPWVL